MGALKEYHHEYLSAEEFDLMFDDEYEKWLEEKKINQDKINQNERNLLPKE